MKLGKFEKELDTLVKSTHTILDIFIVSFSARFLYQILSYAV